MRNKIFLLTPGFTVQRVLLVRCAADLPAGVLRVPCGEEMVGAVLQGS